MATERRSTASNPQVTVPEEVEFPVGIQVVGEGWGDCAVRLSIDGKRPPTRLRVLQGEQHRDAVLPVDGGFVVVLDVLGLEPGSHVVEAVEVGARAEGRAEGKFELREVPDTEEDGRPTMRWLRRIIDFNERRFPGGRRRPGARLRALADRDAMRARLFDEQGPVVDPGCNWYPIGPSVVRDGQVFATGGGYTTAPISGRVTDFAIDPNDTNTIYAATAQGGVWKSTNGGLDWDPKSDFTLSLASGCVTVDPSVTDAAGRSTRILVGTGEPNNSDSYYGAGMLLSTDGGQTWVARGTTTFARAAFSTIAVDPADSNHLIAATDQGVYESTTEGVNWTLVDAGISHDLVVDWANAGGAEVYVGRLGVGVRRRVGTGAWTTLGGGLPAAPGRVALAMAPSDANTLWAAIPSGSTVTFYRTTDGGTTWTAAAATVTGGQLGYNLALGIHPTDPTRLLFGEVHLWRTTNGGGAWTDVSLGAPGIHADQHAIAFHPTDGTKVYAGNDGGAWYSSDGGATWTHRNKDLATLQYFGAASHGTYEAVMLGGTQDNGAQRYVGHPAWQHSALGDGAFTAISRTGDTHQWYETRWYSYPSFRSDTSGSAGSWAQKQSGITTNSNWFYPPFAMDPNDSSVLYCGYDRLFRSSNRADAWTDITGVVSGGSNITAIAIAPSNSGIVYVGLRNGRVFKVAGSGTSWTVTDVSATPIPAGQISDLAVHPTDPNTVYATTSDLIFGEGSESFAADHVYRGTIGTPSTWASVSTGLSQANPVNSIVIDPSFPLTLFIGCDVGIFRSINGGTSWTVWDDGLPNCSVQDLQFFAPQRLLRAATHGRSIWERPVDPATCPLTQLYVRDNVLDTGRVTPSPSGVVDPFDATGYVYWWQSADIKIDSPNPATNAYAFPGLDIDYLQFEGHAHDNPRRETWVRAYAQVHVRGNQPATNVRVRTFWADASGALPPLPADFWTAFPNADPSDTSVWHPVGPAQTILSIAPGHPRVTGWSWQVPSTAATHTCLLAVVTSTEDPIPTLTTTDVGVAVNGSNHVTLKNLHVDNVVPGAQGTGAEAGPFMIGLAVRGEKGPIDIRLNTRGLPEGSLIHLALPPFRAAYGLRKGFVGIRPTDELPGRLRGLEQRGCDEPIEFEMGRGFVHRTGVMHDDERKGRLPGFYGIVPRGRRFAVALMVTLPDAKLERPLTFHVEQWEGEQLTGGSSFELRAPVSDEAEPVSDEADKTDDETDDGRRRASRSRKEDG
jgi:hypothetical protein